MEQCTLTIVKNWHGRGKWNRAKQATLALSFTSLLSALLLKPFHSDLALYFVYGFQVSLVGYILVAAWVLLHTLKNTYQANFTVPDGIVEKIERKEIRKFSFSFIGKRK